ncbi:hypothetical protein H8959_013785 [Pygathrix nigripes]
MCSPRDDNHNTPEPPPPERGRGCAFNQSGPASPGCPTYGVAVAVQGEDVGWSGRGRVRGKARTCRIQVPRRGRDQRTQARSPDAPGMLRAPELLTWGRRMESRGNPPRGVGRRARRGSS